MSDTIECFTGFYVETGAAAVCGIVLTDGIRKWPGFAVRAEGDYLNGLLELLIERIEFWKGKLQDRHIHLQIHVHHKNKNFSDVLAKIIKAADTARGYEARVRDNIIKHTLTRKDYHRPACYQRMAELAKLLVEINDPTYCVTLSTQKDSSSPDQLAVYTACQGEWHDLLAASAEGAADVSVDVSAEN